MKILIVSCSLKPDSRSRTVARMLEEQWEEEDVEFVDLSEWPLPFCDGDSAYGDANVLQVREKVEEADALVFAGPVYVYGVNAAQKNFADLFGHSMEGKLAGFICAAGGRNSYMSIMGFAGSLMLDFRMIVLPRFVYAASGDWEGEGLNENLTQRLLGFGDEFLALGAKLID